jgi:hypothetical protein
VSVVATHDDRQHYDIVTSSGQCVARVYAYDDEVLSVVLVMSDGSEVLRGVPLPSVATLGQLDDFLAEIGWERKA